ncbi:hypothetical protein CY34DRAFT_805002 [Suillus luteus UH-Slu-Lm8-n1]|uniref:Uncharacterized protein n=1 Tax=Suillus luteus UH-Slu-Lm8-n1 TaxID=930992 RepID=A0A0D0AWY5_9AGAM|nr:hypothetical protein CY34DRAFT_805002 [Suillus luteus UH-Slu-Lm8-n1]
MSRQIIASVFARVTGVIGIRCLFEYDSTVLTKSTSIKRGVPLECINASVTNVHGKEMRCAEWGKESESGFRVRHQAHLPKHQ